MVDLGSYSQSLAGRCCWRPSPLATRPRWKRSPTRPLPKAIAPIPRLQSMIVRTRHLQTMTGVIRRLRGMSAPTHLGLRVNIDRIRRLQNMIVPIHPRQGMIDRIRRHSRAMVSVDLRDFAESHSMSSLFPGAVEYPLEIVRIADSKRVAHDFRHFVAVEFADALFHGWKQR